jgi:guanine deaminase
MPLGEPRRRGIAVGLGTDVGAGRTFSLRRVLASAYDNALCLGQPVGPEELFRMATLGGAEALGSAGTIGSLEVGKEADVVAIRLPAGDREAVLQALAFDNDAPAVSRVWVRGKELELRGS